MLREDINKGAMTSFEEFLDKISLMKTENKLSAGVHSKLGSTSRYRFFAIHLLITSIYQKFKTELEMEQHHKLEEGQTK